MKIDGDDELEKITKWDVTDIDNLLEYLRESWRYADFGCFNLSGKNVLRLELHTAGWSGNKDIIEALQNNFIFWMMFWVKSTRGGHYYFKIERRLLCKKPSKN